MTRSIHSRWRSCWSLAVRARRWSPPARTTSDTTSSPRPTTRTRRSTSGGTPSCSTARATTSTPTSSEPPFEHQRVITIGSRGPRGRARHQRPDLLLRGRRHPLLHRRRGHRPARRRRAGLGHLRAQRRRGRRARGDPGRQARRRPTSGESNAENYGCGFLSRRAHRDHRHRQPGVGTGPASSSCGSRRSTPATSQYCKIDVGDRHRRPDPRRRRRQHLRRLALGRTADDPRACYRYSPPFPTGPDAGGRLRRAPTPPARRWPTTVDKELFIDTAEGLGVPGRRSWPARTAASTCRACSTA